MKRWLFSLTVVAALLALLACAAQEEAKPAPAAPAAAPEAAPAWQEEWERVLAAAKREGKVVVAAGGGRAATRRAVTEPFEKRYGITVEFMMVPFAQLSPKIQAERKAGQYLWDVFIGSNPIALTVLKPLGTWDPVEPVLILPEVKDPKNWFGGGLRFSDADRLNLVMSYSTSGGMSINHNLVKAEQFKSYKDLLDPKWKGKILVDDPRISGGGQSRFQFYFVHKELGPDFIRALARQEPLLLRDRRQLAEWLAQGQYPILIGADSEVDNLIEKGLPIEHVDPRRLKEGASLAVGLGTLSLFNRAPHPNAAKVYINWLLTKEGQTEWSRGSGYPGSRLDIPTDHVYPWKLPVEGYVDLGTEAAIRQRTEVVAPFVKEVFGE